jgi:hypothetical protein
MSTVRNRIKCHKKIRAGDLVPHELNPRRHPEAQRAALAELYREIGFARSLLVYELADGRCKLIDGHLRRDLDPDLEVEVEVLDVSDAEARALLLSIDPLAQLAEYDTQVLDQLRQATVTESDVLNNLWQALARNQEAVEKELTAAAKKERPEELAEQFFILVECRDEEQQVELLERFQAEGLVCHAKST